MSKRLLFNCISHEIPCEGDVLIEEHGELRKVEDRMNMHISARFCLNS